METGKIASIATILATGGAMFSSEIRKYMVENPLLFVPAAIGMLYILLNSIGLDVNPNILISRDSFFSSRRNKGKKD